uniref:Putative monocarboxylate transporter n=1 Tax=Ixodes ricinus TaxID=34613 RepID=A0A090XCP6_IXORI
MTKNGVDSSWHVVLITFLAVLVTSVALKNSGFIYVGFMEEFGIDRESASWPSSALGAAIHGGGVFVGTTAAVVLRLQNGPRRKRIGLGRHDCVIICTKHCLGYFNVCSTWIWSGNGQPHTWNGIAALLQQVQGHGKRHHVLGGNHLCSRVPQGALADTGHLQLPQRFFHLRSDSIKYYRFVRSSQATSLDQPERNLQNHSTARKSWSTHVRDVLKVGYTGRLKNHEERRKADKRLARVHSV